MASCTLSLTPVNGELRIYDLHLAERLGFSQARDIRKTIKRYEAKLLTFGVCATVARTSSELGGRPTAEYYLNQKQAIFICMKSETDRAFDVQIEIVRVFDNYLNGHRPALPRPQPLLTEGHLQALNQTAWNLTHPFYMQRATKDWFLSYVRQYIGVTRIAHIPLARYDDAIDFLQSQKKPVDTYLRERIKHERAFLTQSLKRELDRRLGRGGPDFELTAPSDSRRSDYAS